MEELRAEMSERRSRVDALSTRMAGLAGGRRMLAEQQSACDREAEDIRAVVEALGERVDSNISTSSSSA